MINEAGRHMQLGEARICLERTRGSVETRRSAQSQSVLAYSILSSTPSPHSVQAAPSNPSHRDSTPLGKNIRNTSDSPWKMSSGEYIHGVSETRGVLIIPHPHHSLDGVLAQSNTILGDGKLLQELNSPYNQHSIQVVDLPQPESGLFVLSGAYPL